MPPRSSDELDTEPPSNINNDELSESTTDLQPHPSGALTTTSAQIALIESLATRLRIVQALNGLHSNFSYDIALELSSELIDTLQYSFSKQARTNPLFHYSLKASINAALAIISPEPDTGFAQLMAMGGRLFQGVRCATSAISLELLSHVKTQWLNGILNRTRQYRGFLKQAVLDIINLSEDRIRQGETNVKNDTFLSIILAQVKAVEADKPVAGYPSCKR
ncbi:hypothetical protein N7499_000739 [Penicillium canescens]|nr:hypothetical protein N7499_000739 [Penicillium canescens]KAJ6173567.1 hypothetical protein N7485_006379 [Penicillium canescens]